MEGEWDEIAKAIGYVVLFIAALYGIRFTFKWASGFYHEMARSWRDPKVGPGFVVAYLACVLIMFSGFGWMFYAFAHKGEYSNLEVMLPFFASQVVGIVLLVRAKPRT